MNKMKMSILNSVLGLPSKNIITVGVCLAFGAFALIGSATGIVLAIKPLHNDPALIAV